jgi:hypothetical protein
MISYDKNSSNVSLAIDLGCPLAVKINLDDKWKRINFQKTFNQPILLVLGYEKWNMHCKLIFSFEICGLHVA